jgi:bacillithiol biosynthesis cysteine-adding enzyme BshC
MTKSQIPLDETNAFSTLFLDYLAQKQDLATFYGLFPSVENAGLMAFKRQFDKRHRAILVDAISQQYQDIPFKEAVLSNLDLLKAENTFTITTGHQLNLATGPMYVVLKLISTINAAKALALKFPQYHFVPIYWMATEDHDFEEINHFNYLGKTITWQTTQTGAVGKFIVESLESMFPDVNEIPAMVKEAYQEGLTLAKATQKLVHALLGKYGLICLDADQKALKALFAPIMKDEIVSGKASLKVKETIEALKAKGYKSQVNPREINLFYLEHNVRERIEKQGDEYVVLNTALKFKEEELLGLLSSHPEKFSPNVILRPLYQCTILPDIATVGGPAELAYWLQLKSLFDTYAVSFPLLMPRNFALVATNAQQTKLEKIGIEVKDLFQDQASLKKLILDKVDHNHFNLTPETSLLKQINDSLLQKVNAIDPTLNATVNAEMTKIAKGLNDLEKKITKALERKNETTFNQVFNIKSKLFPKEGLQERHDNFFNFQLMHPTMIGDLVDHLASFDFKLTILII